MVADGIVDEVSADRLLAHTAAIARWVRLSGTPDEARAFDYIAATLEVFGYAVRRYRHPALVGYPREATLEVLAPERLAIPCNGFSLSPATPDEGVEGALVFAGGGREDYPAEPVQGRIVLSEGLAMPAKAVAADRRGALAQIHINDEHIHEMCISPVWGTPTPETAPSSRAPRRWRSRAPGATACWPCWRRGRCARACGPARSSTGPSCRSSPPICRASTRIASSSSVGTSTPGTTARWTTGAPTRRSSRWRGCWPPGGGAAPRRAAGLLVGALARPLRRLLLVRGPALARPARALRLPRQHRLGRRGRRDGAGGGADDGRDVGVRARDPARGGGSRTGLQAHQPIERPVVLGARHPSLFASLSEQPRDDGSATATALAQLLGGGSRAGGLGWWWHTTEDTLDKIDPDHLRRDARVYAEALRRLCTDERLPFDYAAVADEFAGALARYDTAAGAGLDLSGTLALARELGARIGAADLARRDPERANALLLALGRLLIPVGYTRGGPFEHDLALGIEPLPGLADAARLGALDPASDDFRFLQTRLVRERNRVKHALRAAIRLVAAADAAG